MSRYSNWFYSNWFVVGGKESAELIPIPAQSNEDLVEYKELIDRWLQRCDYMMTSELHAHLIKHAHERTEWWNKNIKKASQDLMGMSLHSIPTAFWN